MDERNREIWRVLIIDADEDDYILAREMLSQALGRKVYLDWAPSYEEGQKRLQSDQYDAVLVDYDLGPRNGINLIRETVSMGYKSPLILYTGRGNYEVDLEAMNAGATLYLTKTEVNPLLLERSIRYAIERKRVDRERTEILNSIQDGFFALDKDWRIIFINTRAARNGGFEPEELTGRNIWEAFPRLQGTPLERNYRLVMEKRQSVTFEMQGVYQGAWYNISIYPYHEGISVYWQDITERKKAERALQESEERFRAMADGTPLMIWVTDAQGQIEFINQAYTEFFGVTLEQIQSQRWHPLVHPDDHNRYVDIFIECLQQHKMFHAEARVQRSDGKWRWVDSYGQPRFSTSGEFLGMAGSSIDITDRKQAADAVRVYTEQLELSNQALQDFAFMASHDLREPLRKLKGFSERLANQAGDRLDRQEQEYLERMQQATDRMQSMLDGLLAYSRVTIQGSPFEEVDLNRLAAEVLLDLEMQLRETGGSVETGELPVIQADPVQMRQLLQNLIGNAIKFHKPGVPPHVRVFYRPAANDQIELIVEDDGIGFDMASAGQLFQPFHRLVGKSAYEGTGMGLAICQKIAERHNGSITAKGELGAGSTFIVTLPRVKNQ
ncbi:MAG: PAS domain S-box protein [Chloroflexota bacterium]|nr:MAG: PAS domain S-box protein [Chloroflexota bacterium]